MVKHPRDVDVDASQQCFGDGMLVWRAVIAAASSLSPPGDCETSVSVRWMGLMWVVICVRSIRGGNVPV